MSKALQRLRANLPHIDKLEGAPFDDAAEAWDQEMYAFMTPKQREEWAEDAADYSHGKPTWADAARIALKIVDAPKPPRVYPRKTPRTVAQLFRQLAEFVNLENISTGSGCTALYLPIGARGAHVLVTIDASAPTVDNCELQDALCIGLYDRNGNWEEPGMANEIPAHQLPAVLDLILTANRLET